MNTRTRELDVIDVKIIQALACGITSRQIGQIIGVSYRTVEGRINTMKIYFGGKSQTHVVVLLIHKFKLIEFIDEAEIFKDFVYVNKKKKKQVNYCSPIIGISIHQLKVVDN